MCNIQRGKGYITGVDRGWSHECERLLSAWLASVKKPRSMATPQPPTPAALKDVERVCDKETDAEDKEASAHEDNTDNTSSTTSDSEDGDTEAKLRATIVELEQRLEDLANDLYDTDKAVKEAEDDYQKLWTKNQEMQAEMEHLRELLRVPM